MFTKAVVVSLLVIASASVSAAECSVSIDSTDQMSFSQKEFVVPKSCKVFIVRLTHSGSLPKSVMGHNLVVSKTADMQTIVTEGLSQGLDKDYIKADNANIIGHTRMIGGADKIAEVSLDTAKFEVNGDYSFFCSFPGHSTMMKGKVIVK